MKVRELIEELKKYDSDMEVELLRKKDGKESLIKLTTNLFNIGCQEKPKKYFLLFDAS